MSPLKVGKFSSVQTLPRNLISVIRLHIDASQLPVLSGKVVLRRREHKSSSLHVPYHEFVLALKGTMCKFEKLSVGDLHLKGHKKDSNLF